VVNDLGRLGLDSVDNYSGTNYPFLLPTIAREFVEDLQLTCELDDSTPIHLVSITGVGQAPAVGYVAPTVHTVDLQFGRSDGSIPIDTRSMTMTVSTWGTSTSVYTWQDGKTVIQAVINHDPAYASAYQIKDGVLDDRAIVFLPPPVTDIEVYNRTTKAYVSALSGREVKFKAGYNTQFASQTTLSGGLEKQELTISVVPGSGAGRHPACKGNYGITKLGTTRPNEVGDLLLSGKDCIVVKPLVTFSNYGATVSTGQFKIYDSCKPKCGIEDFTAAANYVTRQWNKFVALAKRFNDLRDKYHGIIGTYAAAFACMKANPIKGVVFSAKPCGLVVSINVFNPYCTTLKGGVVRAKVTDDSDVVIGTIDTTGVYTTKYENKSAITVQTAATTVDGQHSVTLFPIPGSKVSSTYIRINLASGGCSPKGKVTLELAGNLNLPFTDLKPVTFKFDLSNA
jgi:hypothetical protein